MKTGDKPFMRAALLFSLMPFAAPAPADSSAAKCVAGPNCASLVRPLPAGAVTPAQSNTSGAANANASGKGAASSGVTPGAQGAARSGIRSGNTPALGNAVGGNANVGGSAAGAGNIPAGSNAAVGVAPALGSAVLGNRELLEAAKQAEALKDLNALKNIPGAAGGINRFDPLNPAGGPASAGGPDGFKPGQWEGLRPGGLGDLGFQDPLAGAGNNNKPGEKFGVGSNTSLPGKDSWVTQGGTEPGGHTPGVGYFTEKTQVHGDGSQTETRRVIGQNGTDTYTTIKRDSNGVVVRADHYTRTSEGDQYSHTARRTSEGDYVHTHTSLSRGGTGNLGPTPYRSPGWDLGDNVDPDAPVRGGGPNPECVMNPKSPNCRSFLEKAANDRTPGGRPPGPDDSASGGGGGVVRLRLGQSPGDPDPLVVNPGFESRPSGGYDPSRFESPDPGGRPPPPNPP